MIVPGRGRWDRRAAPAERWDEQRRAILEAAARAVAVSGAATSVTEIVRAAGVGRNSFYEHFDDAASAVRAARADARARISRALDAALRAARTPVERLRGLSASWIEAVHTEPLRAALLAGAGASHDDTDTDTLRDAVERALGAILTDARAVGAIGHGPEAHRLALVVGAFDAAARCPIEDGAEERRRLADTLADVALRAFR